MLWMAGNFTPVKAQSKPPLEYQVKAAFLFNFTRFIHWPPTAYAGSDAPFVIGIIGNDPFGNYLDDLVSDERTDGHRIIIRRYAEGQDLSGCHLLFIGTNDAGKLQACLALTAHQNILTVSDADNFIKLGGILRFYKEDNKVKMEIRLAGAKAAQLDISAKLLQIAKVK
jgi:hypothetical protein